MTVTCRKLFLDLENDHKASSVQFPEVRTNLARPLSLSDPIISTGHTGSFDARTLHWQSIYGVCIYFSAKRYPISTRS